MTCQGQSDGRDTESMRSGALASKQPCLNFYWRGTRGGGSSRAEDQVQLRAQDFISSDRYRAPSPHCAMRDPGRSLTVPLCAHHHNNKIEDVYLGDTEVSWSDGWRILQVVKVYVELVLDIHLPGKLTRGEEERDEAVSGEPRGRGEGEEPPAYRRYRTVERYGAVHE